MHCTEPAPYGDPSRRRSRGRLPSEGCHWRASFGNINVPVGALDGATAIAVGRHIYVASKASWDLIGNDGAVRHPTNGNRLSLNRFA